jgi:hypothetical protein
MKWRAVKVKMTRYTIERWAMKVVLGVILWPLGFLLRWMENTFYAFPDDNGIRDGSRLTLYYWVIGVCSKANTKKIMKWARYGRKIGFRFDEM